MNISLSFQQLFRRKTDLMPIFAQQAAFLCQSAEILCNMLDSMDSAQWRQSHKDIRTLEHQGDALLTEFREQIMGRPMKLSTRANLITVAMSMDDCLDVVKDASNAVNIYDPQKIDNQLKDLAQLILAEAKALQKLLPLLANVRRNAANITLLCDRITELEHEADEAYEGYIGYIFTKEEDIREMTKYKNLAELFEKATDSGKHVADCVRIMLLGNSEN